MDVLRGCAALLVVNYHAYTTLRLKYPDLSDKIAFSNVIAEPFRMPVLMFLSGLLVHRALQKGTARYVRGKINNIVYPYLIWTCILIALFLLRAAVMGKPMPFEIFDAVFLGKAIHMWFLYYLFLFYLLHLPLASYPTGLVLVIAVLGAVVTNGSFASKFGYMFAFFSLGVVLGRNLGAVSGAKVWTAWWAWPLFAVLGILALKATALLPDFAAKREPLYTLAGLVPIIWLSMRLADLPISAPFRYLGRNSVVVYLAHLPFAMVLPLAFEPFFMGDINLLYPVYYLTVLGLCVLLIEARQVRPELGVLFAPPNVRWRGSKWRSRWSSKQHE